MSGDEMGRLLGGPESGLNAAIYLLLRSADTFSVRYNRLPGAYDAEMDEDSARLKGIAANLLSSQVWGWRVGEETPRTDTVTNRSVLSLFFFNVALVPRR